MSLLSQALTVTMRKMLTDRTWAGKEVYDQPVDPLDKVLRQNTDTPRPAIAVYCDEVSGKPTGRETQGGMQSATVHVFAYLPPAGFDVPDGSARLGADQAGIALNMLGRQADGALHYGNENWISLWRRFVPRVDAKKSRFVLLEIESGARIPTLEMTYQLTCVEEPTFGSPLYGAWVQFDELLRLTPDGAIIADYFKAAIEKPDDIPDYERFRANFALTWSELEATGFAPVMIDETPVLQGVSLVTPGESNPEGD